MVKYQKFKGLVTFYFQLVIHIWRHRLMVRTTAFQAVNRSPILRGATTKFQITRKGVFDLVVLVGKGFFRVIDEG